MRQIFFTDGNKNSGSYFVLFLIYLPPSFINVYLIYFSIFFLSVCFPFSFSDGELELQTSNINCFHYYFVCVFVLLYFVLFLRWHKSNNNNNRNNNNKSMVIYRICRIFFYIYVWMKITIIITLMITSKIIILLWLSFDFGVIFCGQIWQKKLCFNSIFVYFWGPNSGKNFNCVFSSCISGIFIVIFIYLSVYLFY